MKPRRLLVLLPLALIALVALLLPGALRSPPRVPGLDGTERTLLRIWITNSPGGGQAWLTAQLRAYEKTHPGIMTHLRVITPAEAASPGAVLPDVILHMPGDFTDPGALFAPLAADAALRAPLLQGGQRAGQQLGLPLCWGAWVLAIDSALEPGFALTPAPTPLLGKPSATAAPSDAPGFPLHAVNQSDCPLQSPGGAALLALHALFPPQERPTLPENLAQMTAAEVYAAFQARKCATAMLTTGQAIAFSSLVSAGKGFPFRILVPAEVVTDQVWYASLTPDAPAAAAELLDFLTGPEAQQALISQGLHTVRDDLTLYAAGFSAEVEAASRRALQAVNAFVPTQEAHSAAWQVLHGSREESEALPPLL